ncbi:hypothetical protein BS47DRAFT_1384360 [Hydnum rufescens UP504]|uniref:Uncharacterized protein n=1 Tax=Hydnum rufescens UP504 TaxID=1448309 RepID=A0A9P6APB4_9AGAM|nr:hypothetical protein BS47DRAFT_1384360 [Hydnum rufescens UP504]
MLNNPSSPKGAITGRNDSLENGFQALALDSYKLMCLPISACPMTGFQGHRLVQVQDGVREKRVGKGRGEALERTMVPLARKESVNSKARPLKEMRLGNANIPFIKNHRVFESEYGPSNTRTITSDKGMMEEERESRALSQHYKALCSTKG